MMNSLGGIQLSIFSLLLCLGIMLVAWLYAMKIKNYSIVDAVWAASFSILALCFFFLAPGTLERRALCVSLVCLWSVRLAWMLAKRIRSHHPKEDGRYLALREKYAPNVEREFLEFFMIQGLSVVLLSVPFMIMALNSDSPLSTLEWCGAGIVLLSFLGEALADHQANLFKADPKNAGKVCQMGLWRYSRHPNYFFESCIWWGFFIMAAASPWGFVTIYCPLVILYLLLKVTGIPLAEAQSLKSRGEAYRQYQQTTSAFIPWFVRKVK